MQNKPVAAATDRRATPTVPVLAGRIRRSPTKFGAGDTGVDDDDTGAAADTGSSDDTGSAVDPNASDDTNVTTEDSASSGVDGSALDDAGGGGCGCRTSNDPSDEPWLGAIVALGLMGAAPSHRLNRFAAEPVALSARPSGRIWIYA